MKKQLIKNLTAMLLLISLVGALAGAAFADGQDGAEDQPCYTLNGKTWDELTAELLEKYDLTGDRIALGYYNTVTGETHYVNGQEYFQAGSIYKLPLCMRFVEKLNSGELSGDMILSGYTIDALISGSIVNSNNEYAETLLTYLGRSGKFKELIADYTGVDVDTLPKNSQYWTILGFTAEQVISCLKTLYSNAEEYELLLDYMKSASPDKYFKYKEQSVELGHKYGYVEKYGSKYVNDCAVCYTDEPICIVMFTRDVRYYTDALPDYCALMIDYAQASHEQRIEAELIREKEPDKAAAAATEEPVIEPPVSAEEKPAAPEESPSAPDDAGEHSRRRVIVGLCASLPLLLIGCGVSFLVKKRKRG